MFPFMNKPGGKIGKFCKKVTKTAVCTSKRGKECMTGKKRLG